MLRFLALLFASCLLFVSAATASPELKIGVRNNLRTLEFTTTDGTAQGALIELWRSWATTNRTQIEFVSTSNDSLETLLKSGGIDIIANAGSSEELSYSAPYFHYNYYLFSLKKIHLETAEQLPLKIGLLKCDATCVDSDLLKSARVSLYPNHQKMLEALQSGQIDYFIANDINLNLAIKGRQLFSLYYPAKPFYQHPVRAATLGQNKHLLTNLDKVMLSVPTAERQAIISKWFPKTTGYRFSWPIIGLSIAILLTTTLSIAAWLINAKLKLQIDEATRSLVQEKEDLRLAKDEAVTRQKNIKALIDSIHSCIFALNSQGKVTHMNRYAEKWSTGQYPPWQGFIE